MLAFLGNLGDLFSTGGWVMYPLLALSVVSLAMIIERSWFWLQERRRRKQHERMLKALRSADHDAVRKLLKKDRSIDALFVRRLFSGGDGGDGGDDGNDGDAGRVGGAWDAGVSESMALDAVDVVRPSLERFMITLSTIITAAPLLGILGTVLGIIKSFDLLSDQRGLADPRTVSNGIAEALLTTAFGLIIALMTLFPYMAFRSHVERALGRMESLIAAAQEGAVRSERKGARSGGGGGAGGSGGSGGLRSFASAVEGGVGGADAMRASP